VDRSGRSITNGTILQFARGIDKAKENPHLG